MIPKFVTQLMEKTKMGDPNEEIGQMPQFFQLVLLNLPNAMKEQVWWYLESNPAAIDEMMKLTYVLTTFVKAPAEVLCPFCGSIENTYPDCECGDKEGTNGS
jgi:hypothetical protein